MKWQLLTRNPLGDVKALREDERGVVRYLTPDEERRLRAALAARDARRQAKRAGGERAGAEPRLCGMAGRDAGPPHADCARRAQHRPPQGRAIQSALVGCRSRGAQLTVQGEGAKCGQTRHVPLNAEASTSEGVAAGDAAADGRVSRARRSEGGRLEDVKKAWLPVVKAAKLSTFGSTTCATRSLEAGDGRRGPQHRARAPRPRDIKMTLSYAHLAPEHKAAAVAKLVGRVMGRASRSPPTPISTRRCRPHPRGARRGRHPTL